ncbi:MAG TPA: polysaccharide pyruvyl transferase family protein, partial [Paraburkholderia sp.]|uniref:polysaccharide pyruvyl transferase family protein n=1 Tax=Paraburkholderia sp. TaxID=1926495 RepID=UPI002B45BA8A
ALLAQRGIEARLIPDPASMAVALFGAVIRRHATNLALCDVRQAFPHGYAAVQFSADFGDDATLDTLATQLELAAHGHGLGIVLFRAGAAPWHDDLAVYERLAARLRAAHVRVFASLNVWDICALIAGSRLYCGSSLHGRIVAMGYALPRFNISHPDHSLASNKHAAYVRTWEAAGLAGVVNPGNLADAVANALATDCESLRQTASALARRYRMEFETVVAENRL